MKTIFKYPADIYNLPKYLPKGAKFLSLQRQKGYYQAWYEVNPDAPHENPKLEWVGTGQPIPEGSTYLGTALFDQDTLVLHLYQGKL